MLDDQMCVCVCLKYCDCVWKEPPVSLLYNTRTQAHLNAHKLMYTHGMHLICRARRSLSLPSLPYNTRARAHTHAYKHMHTNLKI